LSSGSVGSIAALNPLRLWSAETKVLNMAAGKLAEHSVFLFWIVESRNPSEAMAMNGHEMQRRSQFHQCGIGLFQNECVTTLLRPKPLLFHWLKKRNRRFRLFKSHATFGQWLALTGTAYSAALYRMLQE
jgi:hypothetical protein